MSQISWNAPTPTAYTARNYFVMWGPMIVRVCETKTGARFAARRLNREGGSR